MMPPTLAVGWLGEASLKTTDFDASISKFQAISDEK